APASTLTVTFNESIRSGTISLHVLDKDNTDVPAVINYDDTTHTLKFLPVPPNGLPGSCCGNCTHCPLAANMVYTATLSGVQDLAGNTMSTVKWTFTTDTARNNDSVFAGSTPTGVATANDRSPDELGMKFRVNQDGYITGLSFYKGAGDSATHV